MPYFGSFVNYDVTPSIVIHIEVAKVWQCSRMILGNIQRLLFMSELKPEIKTQEPVNNNIPEALGSPPTPLRTKTVNRKGVLILIFALVVFAAVGGILIKFNYQKFFFEPTVKTTVEDPANLLKGPLKELVLEQNIAPSVHTKSLASDGAVVSNWVYESGLVMDHFFNTASSYLSYRKSWKVSEVSTDYPDKQRILKAVRNNQEAIIVISNKGDKNSLVSITLTERPAETR
jgi:hypothetical protein